MWINFGFVKRCFWIHLIEWINYYLLINRIHLVMPQQWRQTGLGEGTRNEVAVRRYWANTGLTVKPTLQAMERFRSKFVQDLSKLYLIVCPKCQRQELKDEIQIGTYLRNSCRSLRTSQMFTAANSMDPGEVPTQLQGLTDIEEMLIAILSYEFTS